MNIIRVYLVSLTIVFTIFFTFFNNEQTKKKEQTNKQEKDFYIALNEFSATLNIIKQYYYQDIPMVDLIRSANKGIMESLDPYSTMLDIKDSQELSNFTTGNFTGVGLQIYKNKDSLIEVISPLHNSPAFKAGIMAGDIITKINQEVINKQTSLQQVVENLQGKTGTKINITLVRKKQYYNVSVTREVITTQPVISYKDGNIGYIKIATFNENSRSQFINHINKLKKNKVDAFIIDLRNNPGGLVNQAVLIASDLLNGGNIVSLSGKNPADNQGFFAETGDITEGKPIILLINNNSASASEILSGALQENNRALVIGTTSYGKGSIQSIIPLDNKKNIKITTALYYLPSGKTIHKIGIKPDIVVFENGKTCKQCNNEILEQYRKESDYYIEKSNHYIDHQLIFAKKIINKYNKSEIKNV